MTNSNARPMAKTSLKWSMIEEDLSILEKFKLIADLGFDGVELDSPNDLNQAEILAARDATGLAIPGVVNSAHWKTPLTDPDPAVREACVAASIEAMKQAKSYGAETMLLVPGVVNATTSYATAYDRAVEGIDRLLPHAEDIGISIALENVWNNFLLSPSKPPTSSTASITPVSAGISTWAMSCAMAAPRTGSKPSAPASSASTSRNTASPA